MTLETIKVNNTVATLKIVIDGICACEVIANALVILVVKFFYVILNLVRFLLPAIQYQYQIIR